MIDREKILLSPVPMDVGEARRIVAEMGDVLNSMQVQLRDRGVVLGEPSTEGTLGYRLLQAWNHLYWARDLLAKLEKDEVEAPIWTGDEPPLDQMPSPV
jgi:hypothetical protein